VKQPQIWGHGVQFLAAFALISLFCATVAVLSNTRVSFPQRDHRCHRIRAFSSGIRTPLQRGITRGV
jgi:hypothetical protein